MTVFHAFCLLAGVCLGGLTLSAEAQTMRDYPEGNWATGRLAPSRPPALPAPAPAPAEPMFSPPIRERIWHEPPPMRPYTSPLAPILVLPEPDMSVRPVPRSAAAARRDEAAVSSMDRRTLPPLDQARIRSLAPDERRYLMYLYARTGQAEYAEPLAREILSTDPTNKEALLAMSAAWTEKQDGERALFWATHFYRAYPGERDALYYYGVANHLAGRYPEAQTVLRHLRLEKYGGQPFPYQLDLATAAERTGDWSERLAAYRSYLDENEPIQTSRESVRRAIEPIYKEHMSSVRIEANTFLLDPGMLLQERLGIRHQLTQRLLFFAEGVREDVQVAAAPTLSQRWGDDTEGWGGFEFYFNRRWNTAVWAGASQAGLLGGARLTHRLPADGSVWVEGFYQERSHDSLLLDLLDGRQNRITLGGDYLLFPRVVIFGAVTGREMRLENERLGWSVNASWNAELLVFREWPDFRVGYEGAMQRFDLGTSNIGLVAPAAAPTATPVDRAVILNNLVLDRLHRHGLYGDLRSRLYGPLYYHLRGGVGYALERDSIEYSARAGLSFRPRRSVELSAEFGYRTSSLSADGVSDEWEINIAGRWWF